MSQVTFKPATTPPTTTVGSTTDPDSGAYIPTNVLARAKAEGLGKLQRIDLSSPTASFYFDKGSIQTNNLQDKGAKEWPIVEVDVTCGFKLPPFLGDMAKEFGMGTTNRRIIKGNTVSYAFTSGIATYTNGRLDGVTPTPNSSDAIPASVANAAFKANLGAFRYDDWATSGGGTVYFANGNVRVSSNENVPHTGPVSYTVKSVDHTPTPE